MKPYTLISVYDKTGIVEFAKRLSEQFQIVSTGGTYDILKKNGVEALRVSDLTQSPEILDGRVKTLHPMIHGRILAKRNKHKDEILRYGLTPIDLVVVNLYPFSETLKKTLNRESGLSSAETEDAVIEMIDIGGHTLIRAAAKNYEDVTVIVDPKDYSIENIEAKNRRNLARKAFRYIAEYDNVIAQWFEYKEVFKENVNNIVSEYDEEN